MSLPRALTTLTGLAGLALAASACGSSGTSAAVDQPESPTPSPSSAPSVTTYHDVQVRLPVAENAVPGAPAGFVDALRAALTAAWGRYDKDPGCEQVPLFTVEKVSEAGFAALAYNDDPGRAHGKPCEGAGGGTQQFWAVVDGTWTKVVEGQDVPTCDQFERYGLPSSIVGHTCLDPTTYQPQAYRHA